VSSALVGLGLTAQVSSGGTVFRVFALVALPTLFVLGVFRFVRLVELGIEDFLLGRAINRIRLHYLEHASDTARYFMLSGNDDATGVLGNVDAVVGGAAVALVVGIALGTSLGVAVLVGAAAALTALGAAMRFQYTRREAGTQHPVLFPSVAP
jgi:hypothetical protein